ncbi:UNVERIFIED_CONTAM: hypothetical protein FKN15_068547 [Acipenser sinensis]
MRQSHVWKHFGEPDEKTVPEREEPERPQPEREEPERPQPEREEPERPQPEREESVRPQPEREESVRPRPEWEESVRPRPEREESMRPRPEREESLHKSQGHPTGVFKPPCAEPRDQVGAPSGTVLCLGPYFTPSETPDVTSRSAGVTGIPPALYAIPPGASDVATPVPGLSPLHAAATSRSPSCTPVTPLTPFGSLVSGSWSLTGGTGTSPQDGCVLEGGVALEWPVCFAQGGGCVAEQEEKEKKL